MIHLSLSFRWSKVTCSFNFTMIRWEFSKNVRLKLSKNFCLNNDICPILLWQKQGSNFSISQYYLLLLSMILFSIQIFKQQSSVDRIRLTVRYLHMLTANLHIIAKTNFRIEFTDVFFSAKRWWIILFTWCATWHCV